MQALPHFPSVRLAKYDIGWVGGSSDYTLQLGADILYVVHSKSYVYDVDGMHAPRHLRAK